MTSQELQLTDEQFQVIRQMIAYGGYGDASQVLDDARRLLVAKQEAEQTDLVWLQIEVQKIFDTFKRWDVIELDSEEAISGIKCGYPPSGPRETAGRLRSIGRCSPSRPSAATRLSVPQAKVYTNS